MLLTIDDRNPDGRGRGQAGSKVALVSQAHPGEEIAMRVDKSTRGTVQGRVARVVRPDRDRIPHDCRHEFVCTGCSMLALDPQREAAFKQRVIAEQLRDAGVEAEQIDAVLTPAGPFGYRHYTKQVFGRARGRVVLGSYVSGTHDVVDNAECPVLVAPLRALMTAVARAAQGLSIHDGERPGLRYAVARHSAASGRQLLTLVSSLADAAHYATLAARLMEEQTALAGVHHLHNDTEGDAILRGELSCIAGDDAISEELLGYAHRVGPRSFFQINPLAAREVFRSAVDLAGEGATCVEAYAGVGALTLPLSERFTKVVAVESNPEASAALARAAADHGASIETITADAHDALPGVVAEHRPDVLVVDPPRKGLGEDLCRSLATLSVPRWVMVSCSSAALARDLPVLLAAGYTIDRLVPVDQFPRTGHVELVVRLIL